VNASEWDRLRRIERQLAEDDPAFAELLAAFRPPDHPVVRVGLGVLVALAVPLMILGAAAAAPGLLTLGILFGAFGACGRPTARWIERRTSPRKEDR
jgi:Protein of unknown function (DUF3040)